MGSHQAYIGLGSNLGDRLLNCRRALEALGALPSCRLKKTSSFYETEPVGFGDQSCFINGVALVQTSKEPPWLLGRMLDIENAMGRKRGCRWGPRIIDLDLLLFDDLVIDSAELTVPHPLLHQRRFVLQPLSEIAPRLRHPLLGQTVAELLKLLPERDQRVRLLVDR